MLLLEDGEAQQLTPVQYRTLSTARMIYLCDECSNNGEDENVFHIMPKYAWKDVDETLKGFESGS